MIGWQRQIRNIYVTAVIKFLTNNIDVTEIENGDSYHAAAAIIVG